MQPRYSSPQGDRIDLEVDHPDFGFVTMTISPEDYPDLWASVISGPIAPYAAPSDDDMRAAWRPFAIMPVAAFCSVLKERGILSPDDALAAAKGDWPAAFQHALGGLPDGMDAHDAQILWARLQQIERMHPLFEAMRIIAGMTPNEADDIFGYRKAA